MSEDAKRFGCVVLVDRRGWLLLQERDEHPRIDPEKWGLCGGHLEPGEGWAEGAARELAEETGIVVAPEELRLLRELQVHHAAYGTTDPVAVFVAATDLTDDDVVLGEGHRIVFVEPEQARRLDLGGSASIAVPELLDSALYRELGAGVWS